MNRESYRYSDMDVIRTYTNLYNYPKYNPIFSIPIFKRIKASIIKRIQKDEYINMINSFNKRQLYHYDLYDEGTMIEHPCTTLHINRVLVEVKHNWNYVFLLITLSIVVVAWFLGLGILIKEIIGG